MTEDVSAGTVVASNGDGPPMPVLAGHLVLYPDAVAFRPDGGTDEQVIVRPVIQLAGEHLAQLFTPGDGGLLAAVLCGNLSSMNPLALMKQAGLNHEQRRAAKAAMRRGT
jgi:hypothetical protein